MTVFDSPQSILYNIWTQYTKNKKYIVKKNDN